MTDTTAQIAAKGCQSTGITEDLAIKLHDQLGKKVMAVVELVAEARSEKKDGKQKVVLSILSVEPATENIAEDHLRNFQRAMFMNRRLHSEEEQPTLDTGDDVEPTVADVIAHADTALLGVGPDGEPRLWDGNNPDEDLNESQGNDQGDGSELPHEFIEGTIAGICALCELGTGAELHLAATCEEPPASNVTQFSSRA